MLQAGSRWGSPSPRPRKNRAGGEDTAVTVLARCAADGREPHREAGWRGGAPLSEETPVLVAYQVGLELVRALRPVVDQLKTHDRDLCDQITRAGTSVLLNLGEGNLRSGGDRKRLFVYARGSAAEIKAAIDVADAWGWPVDAAAVKPILDRLMGLLWGLTR